MEKAIYGCDAVINTLNVSRKSDNPWASLAAPKDLISKSASNALIAMKDLLLKELTLFDVKDLSHEHHRRRSFSWKNIARMENSQIFSIIVSAQR